MPGVGANFFSNGSGTGVTTNLPSISRSGSSSTPQQQPPQQTSTANFFPTPQSQSQPQAAPYTVFTDTTLSQSPFTTQSPVSPTFNLKTGVNGRNASLSSTLGQQPTPGTALSGDANTSQNPFAGPFFDPAQNSPK